MRARLGRPARVAAFASILIAAVSPALASEIVAVKAGLLIDGTGAPPKKNPVVLVQDGKILAVGVLAPTGATVIDLGDRTLLPGFIDCHVQLAGRGPGEEAAADGSARDLPQEDAIRGVRNAKRTLEAGFTTVRNIGGRDLSDVALRNAIRDGIVPGPRMLVSGEAAGGSGSTGAFLVPSLDAARSPDDIRKATAAGVRIALGSGTGGIPYGQNGRAFELLAGLGMSNSDAILAGTRNAAELLELDKEVGTVEVGKVADLVGVEGNPLADIKTLEAPACMTKAGAVVKRPIEKEKKGLARLFSGK